MNSSEALTFKNVTVTSSEGLPNPTPAEAVVVQPGTGVVVFIHGEPRFVLRQDEGLDVFAARTDNKELSLVSGSSVVKLQFLSDGNAKSFRQAVESRNRAADTRGHLRSSLAAEATMSKATTAYTAAAKEDDYSRRNLANELSLRRDRHRALAQRFNSGSDTESFLIRERFSTAAERSRQRLDQIESRHIERLEAALLAAGNSNSNNNNANDRQKLWDAWAEAEAYRDQDMQRVGLQNKRDTNNVVQWQQTQRRREQIFNELQGELRHFDNVQVSSPQHNYPHQQDSSVLSPQSMRLVEQVRSLLNVHSDEVSHARASGASLAEQQILEERSHQQELLRLEQERREKEEQLRREEVERQRQAQEEARKKWEQEQAENERKKAEAQKPIRMMGDWKELKNPETGTNYFLNVVTRKITTNVQETPFYVPMPVVATADPVLAQQKTNPATTTSSGQQPQQQKPVQQKEEPKPTEQPQKTKQPAENTTSGPQVGEIKGDWKVMLDKASGKIYFYNTATKKTTWKIEETSFGSSSSSSSAAAVASSSSSSGSPKAGDVNGDWKAMLDKASGKFYFYNTATKKTTWKVEETTFANNTAASSSPKQSATTATSSSSSSPQAGEVNGDWKAMLDKASGKIYFYNTATKKTTWKIEETTFATSSSKSSSSSPAATAVGSPKEGEVKGDWKVMLDKASGKNYFYNTSTKKTTWKIEDTSFAAAKQAAASASPASPTSSSSSSPQAGEVKGDWKAMLDKASGKIYFYNGTTKKTTWKIDETSFAQSSNNKSQTSPAPSTGALKAGDVKGDWKVMLDKASGKLYFYNTATKKTTWKQSETPFAQSLDDVL